MGFMSHFTSKLCDLRFLAILFGSLVWPCFGPTKATACTHPHVPSAIQQFVQEPQKSRSTLKWSESIRVLPSRTLCLPCDQTPFRRTPCQGRFCSELPTPGTAATERPVNQVDDLLGFADSFEKAYQGNSVERDTSDSIGNASIIPDTIFHPPRRNSLL